MDKAKIEIRDDSKLAKLDLKDDQTPTIDEQVE